MKKYNLDSGDSYVRLLLSFTIHTHTHTFHPSICFLVAEVTYLFVLSKVSGETVIKQTV